MSICECGFENLKKKLRGGSSGGSGFDGGKVTRDDGETVTVRAEDRRRRSLQILIEEKEHTFAEENTGRGRLLVL